MTMVARFLPQYPKRIQVTDGLTKREANGVITLGFDYENSEFGAELQQAVDSTAADAINTAADRAAAEAAKEDAEAARDIAVSSTTLFDTHAIAESYSPAIAPEVLTTKYFDTDYVRGSGGTYVKNGETTGDLVITLDDDVTKAGYSLVDSRPMIAQYGAVNTLDDIEVWRTAISKLDHGETLAFPAGLKGTLINATGSGATIYNQRADAVANGKLRALTSDKNGVTVVINGQVDFTSALDDGFRFTGDGVKFVGENGKITNTSGKFLADNSSDPTVQWVPTLLRLEGDECEVSGLHFLDHPTVGVWGLGSSARIHHNLFEGGPLAHETGEYTIQFGCRIGPLHGGGSGGSVCDNIFRRSAAGGAAYTAIYGEQTGCTIARNKIHDMLEHGIYTYCDNTDIVGNYVNDSVGDMIAAAIQSFATDVNISGNHLVGHSNFINLQLSSNSRISGNRAGFITLRKFYSSLNSDVIENLLIDRNILTPPAGQYWPIDINLDQPFRNLSIVGNHTKGGGNSFDGLRAAICVIVTSESASNGTELLVSGNLTDGGGSYSLALNRVSSFRVMENNFKDAWTGGSNDIGVRFWNCTEGRVSENTVRDSRETRLLTTAFYAATSDGNSQIDFCDNNLSRPKTSTNSFVSAPVGSQPQGNTQDNLPLRGSFVMSDVSTADISNTAIRTGAIVIISPRSVDAWSLQNGNTRIYVSAVANGKFTVSTANGSNASPTGGVFDYLVLQ